MTLIASGSLSGGTSCSDGRGLVESERGGQLAVGVDLRLEIGHVLLGEGDGIGAGDEAARRRLLAGDRDQRPRELGRVAALPAALCLPPLLLLRRAVRVALDGRRGSGPGRPLQV